MTSKEALEKLLHLHICYDCTADKDCCKTCDSRLCYEAVKKDLEVLEILKNILDANTLFRVFPYKTAKSFSDFIKAEEKVKEWLERK